MTDHDNLETPESATGTHRILGRSLFLFVALLILLAVYYLMHKPFTPDPGQLPNVLPFSRLAGIVFDIGLTALIVTSAGGIGAWLLRQFITPDTLNSAEWISLTTVIGLGGLSLLVLLLGLIGLLAAPVLWLMLAALLALTRRDVLAWGAHIRRLMQVRPQSRWTWFLAGYVALTLSLALMNALLPPNKWDALMYHLVGPQTYLEAGRIIPVATNHYLGFPQNAEMLFTLALGLTGRDTPAALLAFTYGLLALMGAAGLVRHYTNAATAWLAPALLLSSFSLWRLMTGAVVDLAVLALTAATFIALLQWQARHERGWLVVVAGLCGLALGVKYTAGLLAITAALYILAVQRQRALPSLVLFGLVTTAVFAPWLLRAAVQYDNPVYPFIWGGLGWDALRAEVFFSPGLLSQGQIGQIPFVPLIATLYGSQSTPDYNFTIGFWLLLAPPLLLPLTWPWLDARARTLATHGSLLLLVLLVLWMGVAAFSGLGLQPRLVIPVLLAGAVAGAVGFYGLERWPTRPLNMVFIVRVVLAATLVLLAFELIVYTFRAPRPDYLTGNATRDDYLYGSDIGAHYHALRRLAELPTGSVVSFAWEPRSYYCPPGVICQPDILTDRWHDPLRRGLTPDEVMADWYAAGTDYVLFWQPGYDYHTIEARDFQEFNRLFVAARDQWLQPVWSEPDYVLYTWRDDCCEGLTAP